MVEFKQVVEDAFDKYIKFDNAVKKENEKLQELKASIKDLDSAENLTNIMLNSIIANSQLKANFENLFYLINLFLENNNVEDSREDISKYYKDFAKFKTKNIFTVEKEELVAVDNEVLEKTKKEMSESQLFKIISQQSQAS
jgi:hypothetical protein